MDFVDIVKTGTPHDVQAAISNGANVNVLDKNGWTALMNAAEYNQNLEVITALLAAGADAKAKDKLGNTAFDYAQTRAMLKDTDAYRKLREASRKRSDALGSRSG